MSLPISAAIHRHNSIFIDARLSAQDNLRQLLSSGSATISGTIHDRYGREVRNVQVNGQDVGEAMIGAGVARHMEADGEVGADLVAPSL